MLEYSWNVVNDRSYEIYYYYAAIVTIIKTEKVKYVESRTILLER